MREMADITTIELVATLRDTGDVMARALDEIVAMTLSDSSCREMQAIKRVAEAALRVREKEFKLLEEKGVKL